ncbi:hypothetical protein BU15DRAFT_54536 [Melanogaster broomeanus]|nr:hypothetical protein BU15DRAFT_54536 [Melanogaster broomeanus]
MVSPCQAYGSNALIKLFSQKDTPLMPDAVPMLARLETALWNVSNSGPEVIRLAVHAGVLLWDKYYTLLDECEVYSISIGACHSGLFDVIRYSFCY